jgi:preprotein translocase subunit SecG
MELILTLLHVAVCIALILIVLLQRGKGQSMGAAFGGSSQTVFGSSGAASFLQKLTTASAIIFMLTSLSLAFLFNQGTTSSIMEGVSSPQVPGAVPTESAAPVGETQEK